MEISQLNANHKATLKKFREAVKDCQLPDSDDTFFLRWLIARDYDIPRAEKMLRNSLEWRRQYRIDSVREEFKSPEVFKKYFPAGFVGRDKYCNPLWVVRYGMADMKGILHSAKKKDYFMHVIGLVETSIWLAVDNPKRYRRTPDTLVQSTIIFDLDQFSMRHITYKPAMDAALQLIQLYEANYPELLRRVFVINAPKVFSIAFTMIKPFLHERTKSKISIFGHDSKQWKLAILEDVDPEELPASYGGTLTDPDGNENCITMVNMGGEVPKSYYFTGRTETINKTFLSISSGCKERLEYHVQEAGSVLKWNFHSEDSDIAFAIYRKQGNELISIVPHDRVDCHVSAEEGEIECDEPGVYIVEFDNGFSYLRSKKIWYTISVHPTSLNNSHNGNGLDNV